MLYISHQIPRKAGGETHGLIRGLQFRQKQSRIINDLFLFLPFRISKTNFFHSNNPLDFLWPYVSLLSEVSPSPTLYSILSEGLEQALASAFVSVTQLVNAFGC